MRALFPLIHTLFALSNDSKKGATPYQTVDVAVIGSGFAGLAAAIEAAKSGASRVAILEKMPSPGGNSNNDVGQIAAVGTPQQTKANVIDSVELMMKDMSTAGLNLNDPSLLETMVRSSADTVQWTEKELGVKYKDMLLQLEGHSVPRTLITENALAKDIIDPMLKKVKSYPSIDLKLKTKLEGLVMDESGKRIWGVRVKQEPDGTGGGIIKCTKGVILASGGFSANVSSRPIQNSAFKDEVKVGKLPGATSDVFKEALKIGASSVQQSDVQECVGGLQINPDGQIIHINGNPIEGLYAAGEITGGIHGAGRLASCTTLECLTFGIIAGRNAVTSDEDAAKKIKVEKEIKRALEMEKFMEATMMSPYRF